MAAEEPEVPTVAATPEASGPPKATGKAKAKGKGKSKGKGKAKAKARGGASKTPADDEAGNPEAPKAQKPRQLNFKAQMMADIGDRDIDDVMAGYRKDVVDLKARVQEVQAQESEFDEEISAAHKALMDSSQQTRDAVAREDVALGKYKAVKEKNADGGETRRELLLLKGDIEKEIALLQLDANAPDKVQQLEEAKKASQQAAEAAKKALEEAKLKEKEAASAAKTVTADVRARENEVLQALHDKRLALCAEGKASKGRGKGVTKDTLQAIKDLAKKRQERDKAREHKVKEAMGGGGGRGRGGKRAIGEVPTPSKQARVQDVD